ncbi:MAG: ATP-binding protein [Pseudomonadota bacterium]
MNSPALMRQPQAAAGINPVQDIQSALLNILEDFSIERQQIENTQRAVLNVLDDFDAEKLKVVMAYRGLEQEVAVRIRAEEALRRQTGELERSNQDLERFAFVASHDLQEPLRMVGMAVQLMQKKYQHQLGPEADEYIGYALDGVARMRSLILGLLEYSRVGQDGQMKAVDVGACLQGALKNMLTAIRDRGAEVRHDAMPEVIGNAPMITQLFQNLIGNALKFCQQKTPRVHIGARRQGSDWCFSVADNGIGIAPEHFDKIFVIFQRLHSHDQYAGTGIGLSVCKRIVEHHGGRIGLESTPGTGSRFHFTLKSA